MAAAVSVLSLSCLFLSAFGAVDYSATASYDSGAIEVSVDINDDSTVDIVIVSDSSDWVSVGFGGDTMTGYVIIVDDGNIYEYSLAGTNMGSATELTSSFTSNSQTTNDTTLVTSLTRPTTVSGSSSSSYYDFSAITSSSLTIDAIWASKSGSFSTSNKHDAKAVTTMTFTDESGTTGGTDDDDAAFTSQVVGVATYVVFIGLAMFMIV